MIEPAEPFELLEGVVDAQDIAEFTRCCKTLLEPDNSIPSYALIDHLELPAYKKLKVALERHLGVPLYYLNDFYIYTDDSFGANWHMDTELFTFAHAINAWILLSPDEVTDPLGFIPGVNDAPERYFHSMKAHGDECTFSNFSNGSKKLESLRSIEQHKTSTPRITLGDVLVLNPRRFHKTNVESPKHSLVIKFVYADEAGGLLSPTRVPAMLWPEVGIFTKLVKKHAEDWNSVLDGIRSELKTDKGRAALSAGFFPEKVALYKRMVRTLP